MLISGVKDTQSNSKNILRHLHSVFGNTEMGLECVILIPFQHGNAYKGATPTHPHTWEHLTTSPSDEV